MKRRFWLVMVLALLILHYLHWRITATLNLSGPWISLFSVVVFVAELWLLGHWLLLLFLSLAPQRSSPLNLGNRPEVLNDGDNPSVDVLVPTCGEPLDVIERCLRGCIALDYPHVVIWLLDETNRSELQQLCMRLSCVYRSRTQHDHAKAGNLNHVLPELQGDLIAVFDADVVPVESFLRRTVSCFETSDVGLVQTPQTYMNADPIIRNLGLERWMLPDEESFYRWIEPARQGVNAVVCAGTSFVVRRKALMSVGKFETATPSEDLATGIRLTAQGWRCLFLREKLSAGLAPLTSEALVRQRCRWASGTLQTLRTGASPLKIPGLTFWQRVAYLEGILHWLNVFPQMILMIVPLAVGIFGVTPVRISSDGLLQSAGPLVIAQLLLTRWITGHSRTALLPELYRWMVLLPLFGSVFTTLLGRPKPFQVTPKTLQSKTSSSVTPKLLMGVLTLQIVALLNLLSVLFAKETGEAVAFTSSSTQIAILIWSLLNTLLLVAAWRCCHDRDRDNAIPWFAWNEPVTLSGHRAKLTALSEAGAEFLFDQALPSPPPVDIQLVTQDGLSFTLHCEQATDRAWGGCWSPLSESQIDALHHLLYRRSGQWPMRRAPAEPVALLVLCQRLLTPMPRERWFHRSLIPVSRNITMRCFLSTQNG